MEQISLCSKFNCLYNEYKFDLGVYFIFFLGDENPIVCFFLTQSVYCPRYLNINIVVVAATYALGKLTRSCAFIFTKGWLKTFKYSSNFNITSRDGETHQ